THSSSPFPYTTLFRSFCMGHSQSFVCAVFPAFGNLNLNHLFCTGVDSVIVHLNDGVTLSSVGSLCGSLHQLDGMLLGNDVGQLEECRLQNGVDTSAQSDLLTDLDTVDHIELDVVVGNECFHLSRQMFLQSFHIPRAVQKEGTSVYQLLYHVVLVHIGGI